MAKIVGRYGRAQANEMRRLLGVRELPIEGMPEREIQGVRVYVAPQAPLASGQRKRSTHRVFAICECGKHVPVGRLHQHKCKE
jgi:hypothetical protein